MVCQKNIAEEFRCPADAKRSIKGVGYKILADNIFGFSKVDYLPDYRCNRPDDGDGIEATLTNGMILVD